MSTAVGAGTLVVVPTYNEAGNIERLVSELLRYAPAIDILVIDDASTDGTPGLVQELAAKDGRVRLMERPSKLGLGTAYIAGFHKALDGDYRFTVTMDADFSHDPRHLPELLSAAETPGADVVVGSRYVPGGGIRGWGLHRRVLSFCANNFARITLRLTPHDLTGAYRCYSRPVLQKLDLEDVRSHGYSALIELLWFCQRQGFKIKEVPIVFVDRVIGESKVSRSEITRGLSTVLRLRFTKP